MMAVSVGIEGDAELLRVLENLQANIPRAVRVALVAQAAAKRDALVDLASAATGISREALKARCPIVAGPPIDGIPSVRIMVRRAWIPVPEYRHSAILAGPNPTRARIALSWPGGPRKAAGFINPLGAQQHPLTTRRKTSQPVGTAFGPSASMLLRAVDTPAEQQKTAAQLLERAEAQISAVLQGK